MTRVARLLTGLVLSAALAGLAISPSHPARATGGALFGLFPGANNVSSLGAPSWTEMNDYLPAMVNWQGRSNDIINIYNQIHGSGGVDTVINSYLPHIWDDLGSVPFISLNTNNWTNAQIISGAGDADIDYYANSVKQWVTGNDSRGIAAPTGGRRLYIRLDWEVNGDFSPWEPAKSATTCAQLLTNEQQYVQMWQHFYSRFMTTSGLNNTQIQWVYNTYYMTVFNPVYASTLSNCSNGASDVVGQTYPGNAYVDWVGTDGYAYNNGSPYQSAASILGPMFTRLRALTTRPMSIAEVGISVHSDGSLDNTTAAKGAWIADYFNYIEAQNVRMNLWFNDDLGPQNAYHDLAVFCQANNMAADPFCAGDSQITGSDGRKYNVYTEYATGVGGAYFTPPDPTNSRLLTDTEFQGL